MKRQKLIAMKTLPKAVVDPEELTRGQYDRDFYPALDKMIDDRVAQVGGRRLGRINHLREEYPEPRTQAPAKRPNQGILVDWRAWAFVEVPE
jgi:hypothetical protein